MGKVFLAVLLDNAQAVYYPGQMVTGRVKLNLADDMKVKAIILRFHGYADVLWSEESGSKDNRTTTIYHSNETYMDVKIDVYGSRQDSVVLKPGNYAHPFSFQLPPNCPSSYEGNIGRVRYYLQATIDIPWSRNKYAKTMFTVVTFLDLNQVTTHGNLNEGGEFSNSKTLCCLCCESDPITGTMKVLNRRGYVPGEAILFNAEIDNTSRRTMKLFKAQLIMNVVYNVGRKKRSVNHVIYETQQHGKIESGDTAIWTNRKLYIPAVPPSFLNGCDIIDITYYATLVVVPSGPSVDLQVPVEVVIGSIPLANIAQQYCMTIPTLPTAPPAGGSAQLYSDPVMPPSLPHATFRQSAVGQDANARVVVGEDNKSGGNFAPVYIYYNWERRDPASNFAV